MTAAGAPSGDGGGIRLQPSTRRVLDLDHVIERIAGHTQTPMGAARVRERPPLDDREAVEERHRAWRQMQETIREHGSVGLAPARPLDEIFARVRVEGQVLDGSELVRVAATCGVARSLRRHLRGAPEEAELVVALGERVPDLERLGKQIEEIVDDEGRVRDGASPRLRRIRSRSRSLRTEIRQRLEGVTKEPEAREALQDPIVTERSGRLVLPVRAEQRDRLQGVVHDTSSSGRTLYVEPLDAVEDQNRLAELGGEEREEVRRLLAELTAHVRVATDALRRAIEAIAEADCLQACARYAGEVGGVAPRFVESGLRLVGVVHPLVPADRFIPLDLEMDPEYGALVITGPNTGGKTVSLKTVAVTALMAQAGFPVPATEVRLPIFARVHADIGDEQSLETNLSTFSAHMHNIRTFLQDCPAGSLVILDELGTGTDPEEGAALGIALLERFLDQGALVLVSTHHDALKSFAHGDERALNAAMEFDPETLEPTYRIRVGEPGRSNALDIAAKLGLAPELIDRARDLLGAEAVQLDAVIRELESGRSEVEELRRRLRAREEELQEAREAAEASERERAERYEELERAARQAVREAAEEVRERGAERLRRLEEQEAESDAAGGSERSRADRRARWAGEAGQLEGEAVRDVSEKLRRRRPAGDEGPEEPADGAAEGAADDGDEAESLEAGQPVRVAPFGLEGTVSRAWSPRDAEDARVEVDVDGKRLVVEREQVEPTGSRSRRARRRRRPERASGRSRPDVRGEIDLHGLRVEEAIAKVDKYLDDAMLADVSPVRLIHGFGTGALRNAIRSWLGRRPGVRSWEEPPPAEGGAGVTVVHL